jgi:hypothetical protein
VSPDGVHAGGFVERPNLVAAVAADGLVSEHAATDTAEMRLEGR